MSEFNPFEPKVRQPVFQKRESKLPPSAVKEEFAPTLEEEPEWLRIERERWEREDLEDQEYFLEEERLERKRREAEQRAKKMLELSLGKFLPHKLLSGLRSIMFAGMGLMAAYEAVHPQDVERILISHDFVEHPVPEGSPSPEQMLNELEQSYGEDFMHSFARAEVEQAVLESPRTQETPRVDPELEGFGVRQEDVDAYIREGLPSFMGRRSDISHIGYSTERLEIQEEYHLGPDEHAAGTCSIAPNREASEIYFYPDAFGVNPDDPFSVRDASTPSRRIESLHFVYTDLLAHEISHSVDWSNIAEADASTRTLLLYRLSRAVRDSETMLRFGYAEHITNPDPRVQLRNRTIEYFADLLPAVLDGYDQGVEDVVDLDAGIDATTDFLIARYGSAEARVAVEIDLGDGRTAIVPQGLRTQPQIATYDTIRASVRAVVEYIRALDPDFDFHDAQVARLEALRRAETAYALATSTEALQDWPEGPLRDQVQTALRRAFGAERANPANAVLFSRRGFQDVTTRAYDMGAYDPDLGIRARDLSLRLDRAWGDRVTRVAGEGDESEMANAAYAWANLINHLDRLAYAPVDGSQIAGLLGEMHSLSIVLQRDGLADDDEFRELAFDYVDIVNGSYQYSPELIDAILQFHTAVEAAEEERTPDADAG